MLTLGVETSCDETSISIVDKGKVLANTVSSSVHLHAEYGGVIPEIASRYHVEYIYDVLCKTLIEGDKDLEEIELIAVTKGPGLPGSLLVGISFAKALSLSLGIPLIGVDHVKAHVYSAFLDAGISNRFPFTGMVVSGGHTSIYECGGLSSFKCIGQTRDDAVGEAFDKVAKMMDLGYPGGPVVEKRARSFSGDKAIKFPRALMKDSPSIDFSFSGLKTAVLYHWKDSDKTDIEKDRVCYSFQEAVLAVIGQKIKDAIKKTGCTRFAVGGGVICNERLRDVICDRCKKEEVRLFLPKKEYCSDNAAMIAGLGEELFNAGERSDLYLNVEPGR